MKKLTPDWFRLQKYITAFVSRGKKVITSTERTLVQFTLCYGVLIQGILLQYIDIN